MDGRATEMRVLETITSKKIGGADVFVAELCQRLAEMGAEVELFCPAGRPFVDYAARRGIHSINWKTHSKLDPMTVVRLTRLIRKKRIDIIHTHLSTASLLGSFAARLAGIPSVAHVHGLNKAICFRYATVVIAVSEAVKRQLCRHGLPEDRVRVIHNGVDLSRFESVRSVDAKKKLGFDADTPLFGVFGRLLPVKGQRTAIEAMSIMLQERPDARLILAGEGGDRRNLQETADKLGIGDRVIFAGFVDDVQATMSACDAVIIPSLKEGFGLTALEAMALERPVIASDVGGLPEIVVPGETGFLTPPENPIALAQAMEAILRDPARSQEMGRRGRERAANCFEIGSQMRKVMDVLRETAGKSVQPA